MEYFSDLVVTITASVLVISGTAKISKPGPITETLFQLGVPVTERLVLGRSFGIFEILLAGATVLSRSLWAAYLLGAFALAISVSAIVVLLRGQSVMCNCFGMSDHPLGVRQLVQLPLWMIASWSVTGQPAALGGALDGRLAMLATALAISAGVSAWKLWIALAPLRIARQERSEVRPTAGVFG